MKKSKLSLLSLLILGTMVSCTIAINPSSSENISSNEEISSEINSVSSEVTSSKPSSNSSSEKASSEKQSSSASSNSKASSSSQSTSEKASSSSASSASSAKPSSVSSVSSASSVSSTKSSSASSSTKPIEENTVLDIVELNDLHGYAYESSNNSSINLATASYYVNQLRNKKEYDNVLLIANGDMFQGTAFSNLSYGKSVINAMNEMNFDFMGVGNHEFDWGFDKITNYFDKDTSNGEANFPLINGNVKYTSSNTIGKTGNSLVGYETNDNILPYTIVEKSGVKVGILSYIGPLTNDINQNKLFDYYLDCTSSTWSTTFVTNTVKKDALKLKELGADIIILNTHNGTSDGVESDPFDNAIATIKDSNDNYLIDAVINGHTHTKQYGTIERSGGLGMPVVQAGCYCNAIGRISLDINTTTKKVTAVTDCNFYNLYSAVGYTNKDQMVQNVLNAEYALIKDQITQVYTKNASTSTREQIGKWTVNIMKAYAGADVSFINTGGIRSELKSGNITISELYAVNPFDNYLMYVKAKGSEIKSFYNANSSYYYFNEDLDVSTLQDNTIYKVFTIDYVYYSTYFTKYFKTATLDKEDTGMCARDLMKLDCIAKGSSGLNLSSNRSASLEVKGWVK